MASTYTPYAYHDALMRRLTTIGDWADSSLQNAQAYYASRPQQTYGGSNGGGVSIPTGPKGSFASFLAAISQRESGGRYGARNPDSGALGKYQIMPGNIPSWSREALGHSISAYQFLHTPSLQEQIAQYKLKQYFNKYGPGGAAVAWYAGPGTANKWIRNHNSGYYNSPQGKYSSINAYAMGILRAMGLA